MMTAAATSALLFILGMHVPAEALHCKTTTDDDDLLILVTATSSIKAFEKQKRIPEPA
jgi:hypothetical protein